MADVITGVTTRGLLNKNFPLIKSKQAVVERNVRTLNSMQAVKDDKWCRIFYSRYAVESFGQPFKKFIGRYEIAVMPDKAIYLKKSYADLLPEGMVEVLTDEQALAYSTDEVAKNCGLVIKEKPNPNSTVKEK